MGKFLQFSSGILTGATSVLAVKSYRHYRQDIEAAYQRVQNNGQTIQTAAGSIHFDIRGEGAPVLIIHGMGGGFDQGLQVAQRWKDKHRWIAPSRFGYLGSSLPQDACPAAQADAYAALLDHLDINRAPIIGMSAGGPSAIQFALRYPDRCSGLVLLAGVSKAMIDVASNHGVMENTLKAALISDWLIWWGLQFAIHKIRPPLGVPAKVLQEIDPIEDAWLKTLLMYQLPLKPRRAGIVNDFSQVFTLDIFPLEQIHLPTLIIHAKDDTLVSIKHARFSAQFIPDARLVELPSGGHLFIGQRDHLQAEVEAFLAQVTRGK